MSVEVKAPMRRGGDDYGVLVKVGDRVSVEDELIILEAMKMENPICAPGRREGVARGSGFPSGPRSRPNQVTACTGIEKPKKAFPELNIEIKISLVDSEAQKETWRSTKEIRGNEALLPIGGAQYPGKQSQPKRCGKWRNKAGLAPWACRNDTGGTSEDGALRARLPV